MRGFLAILRSLLLFAALFGLLAGCTRSRSATETPAVVDPAITAVISETVSGGEDPLVTLITPESGAADSNETPTAAVTITPATIDYYVQDGDTLLLVAQKFGLDIETIRRLNYLPDDNIFVGQILQMPFQEGVTAEGVPTATPEPFRHEVVAGDSLGAIAEQFGVSTVAIMEANSMSDPNSLFVGQQLLIPGYKAPTSSTTTPAGETAAEPASGTTDAPATEAGSSNVTHVVQPGDTLSGIAQAYGVDTAAIMSANNIANGNQLRVGQKLTIPGISELDAARARGRVHIIQSGESLTAIALLYGVTAQEIIDFNGISNPDAIYVGQQLIIPGQ